MDAVNRAMSLMVIPMNQLPPIAYEFAKHLCSKVGMCMETFLTAYAVYAQVIEGLPCEDQLYKARNEDIEWFRERRQIESQTEI